MKVLIVLSHLMNKNNILNSESIARAEKAIEIYHRQNIKNILTIGWDYRLDSDFPIALAFKKYLSENGVNKLKIRSDINSRDTVGDAIFSKINFLNFISPSKIFVVTSGYHAKRTKIIFEKILNMHVNIISADNKPISEAQEKKEHESLNAFYETFKFTDFNSDHSLIDTLQSKHPFYNGTIYSKLEAINELK